MVSLLDDDPHSVEGLLVFTYTLEYPDWVHNDLSNTDCKNALSTGHKSQIPATQWETHLGLFVVADKYQIRVLKKMAKTRLQTAMMDEWMAGNFFALLNELWKMEQSGVEDLRNQALSIVCTNSDHLEQKSGFQELMEGNSAFSKDFVHQMVRARKALQEELSELKTGAQNNKELRQVRQRFQEEIDFWVYGQGANALNKTSMQNIINEWKAVS